MNALSGCVCVFVTQFVLRAVEPNFACPMSSTKKRSTADVICIVFCVVPYMYRRLLSIITKSEHVLSMALLAVIVLGRWARRFGTSLLCPATARRRGCSIPCRPYRHVHGSLGWSDRKCGSSQNMSVRAVAYRGGWFGVFKPPRNSEVIGEVLDRVSNKNRRLDFLL